MPPSFWRGVLTAQILVVGLQTSFALGDEGLDRLLKRCREHLTKIKSIEETATIKWVHMPATDERPNGENTYVIRTDGRRFYDELHQDRATPDPNPDRIQVFNGRQFLQFDKLPDRFYKKTQAEAPIRPPLCMERCFSWAFVGGEPSELPNWNSIRSDRIWTDVAARARYAGKKEDGGKDYEVLELSRKRYDGVNVKITVLLDPSLNFFPAKVLYHGDGKLLGDTVVTRHKLIKSGADELVIPLEVKSRKTSAGPQPGETTLTIDEHSLRINEEIKEEVFHLGPMGAVVIIDGDVDKQ